MRIVLPTTRETAAFVAVAARVTTSAAYRTTTTTHSAHADGHGNATVDYRISDATPSYKVKVSVTVRKSGRAGFCSTWFTPHS